MQRFLIFFICITSAFATEYSILTQFRAVLPNDPNCPPLFHGPNCSIPWCVPGYGTLVRNQDTIKCFCFHQNVTVTGEHCEKIECGSGILSQGTLRCICPFYYFGDACEYSALVGVALFLGSIFLYFLVWYCISKCSKLDEKNTAPVRRVVYKPPVNRSERLPIRPPTRPLAHPQAPISPPARLPAPTPTPEVRIVERVVERVVERIVYVEVRDAPPNYESADLPNYETAMNDVEPPKYSEK